MPKTTNDFTLNVATVNGSGSQSANTIILKALFRMGIPTGGKNLFPSNIAGLPTWFSIRVNEEGFIGRKAQIDICVAMNQQTIADDIASVTKGGVFIFNDDIKFDRILLRKDVINYGVPFRKIVDGVTTSIKMKRLLTNMIYVGIMSELIKVDETCLREASKEQFAGKNESVLTENYKAIEAGIQWTKENIKEDFPFEVRKSNGTQGKVLIDGNTSAALGLVFGGCAFMSWYPITPSSSLAEAFQRYAQKYRKDSSGKNTFAILQAEDELSAIGMVLGAGWGGTRAVTTTSGPGISLMSEFAGYSYYAEIPGVIWDVQRAGPSTGLPTRTSQGDVLSIAHLSHGDTKHIMLFPATPKECFEFAQTSLDLSEKLQTLVFVLSDLDLGMNFWIDDPFDYPDRPFDRGKRLTAEQLKDRTAFNRYEDVDDDGVPYRTLPGTAHPLAPYFTRGSGHDEKAKYTESHVVYKRVLDRLLKKFETARELVPAPVETKSDSTTVGLLAYGSTDAVMKEALSALQQKGIRASYLRIRGFPFHESIKSFIEKHDTVFVIEQNRDAQMKQLLAAELGQLNSKIFSVLHYDGLPIHSAAIVDVVSKDLNSKGARYV